MRNRKLVGRILVASAVLTFVGCAGGYKKFDPATAESGEGAFMGRVSVVHNGVDITSQCHVGFGDDNKPWIALDQSGLVFDKTNAGKVTLNRVLCRSGSFYHYNPVGAAFNNLGNGNVTYFGDVTINWDFDGGFKGTALLGGLGAGIETGGTDNEGTITMEVENDGPDTAKPFRKIASKEGRPPMIIRRSLMTVGH